MTEAGGDTATRLDTVVVYLDGSVERVRMSLRSFIEVERRWTGQAPPIEGTAYAAWWSLGRPGLADNVTKQDKVDKAFDAWLGTVDEIDARPPDADPSVPAPTGD